MVHAPARVAGATGPLVRAAPGTLSVGDGFGAVLCGDFLDASGQPFDRFVPGDLLPVAGTALAFAPQRISESIGIVEDRTRRKPFAAHPAFTARVFRIALHVHESAILVNLAQHSAFRVAFEAVRLHYLSPVGQRDDRCHTVSFLAFERSPAIPLSPASCV